MKAAVVMAWRQGETEVNETVESARASLGKGQVLTVEDKDGDGPGRTRHRGIVAAGPADVVIICDPHMRFDGDLLRGMAKTVHRSGGLLCAKCYHNPDCSFDTVHPSGATYYAGATICYRGEDQNGKQALVWKWATDQAPGPRACVGGACYAFRRDWYDLVGQPLSALPAWGCDEEALSISAWLSGYQPTVFDGRCAHRWRKSPPWNRAKEPLWKSRVAMVCAVASDPTDRADLLRWQGQAAIETPEIARWRSALARLPRTWAEWKAKVPVMPYQPTITKPVAMPAKRTYTPNLTAIMPSVICPHCHARHDPKRLRVENTYPNGNRRHRCPAAGCNRPFVSIASK